MGSSSSSVASAPRPPSKTEILRALAKRTTVCSMWPCPPLESLLNEELYSPGSLHGSLIQRPVRGSKAFTHLGILCHWEARSAPGSLLTCIDYNQLLGDGEPRGVVRHRSLQDFMQYALPADQLSADWLRVDYLYSADDVGKKGVNFDASIIECQCHAGDAWCRLVNRSGTVFTAAGHPPLSSPRVIVQRAASKVTEQAPGYSALLNNCEHFALWCATGEKYSLQAQLPKTTQAQATENATAVLKDLLNPNGHLPRMGLTFALPFNPPPLSLSTLPRF